jgi:predicted Rossmann-fold nucleotide-binding protein
MSSAESIGLREFGYVLVIVTGRPGMMWHQHRVNCDQNKNRVVGVMIKIESGSMLK